MSFLKYIPHRKDGILVLPFTGYLESPLPLPQSLYGRLDGLPNLLTQGASHAGFARARAAIKHRPNGHNISAQLISP